MQNLENNFAEFQYNFVKYSDIPLDYLYLVMSENSVLQLLFFGWFHKNNLTLEELPGKISSLIDFLCSKNPLPPEVPKCSVYIPIFLNIFSFLN